jgi:hypothetical protein
LFSILSFNSKLWYIIFINLFLIVLNFFFFGESYFSFQFHPLIKKLFLYFFVNFNPYYFDCFFFQVLYSKLIFHFIFTLQSNINFILYFNFNCHSFKKNLIILYSWNSFFFNFILQYLIDWELIFNNFSKEGASGLMPRVTSLKN